MELDSHADTIVIWSNFVLLSYTDREYDVSPYDISYEPTRGIAIVHVAIGWKSPITGQTYMLFFNESF